MPDLFDIPVGYETKMKIIKAINTLSADTLGEVTIKDICDVAGVSKGTFYHHFLSKYDAVNWYHHTVVAKQSFYEVGRTLTWNEGVTRCFELVKEVKNLYVKSLQEDEGYESLFRFSVRDHRDWMLKTITEYNGIELSKSLEYAVGVWSYTGSHCVTEWIAGGCVRPIDELACFLDLCRPVEVQKAMNDPVIRRREATE